MTPPKLTGPARVLAFLRSLKLNGGLNPDGMFEPEPWQIDIINRIYAVDTNGRRIARRAYIGIPRKNGKTALAAGLGLYHLVADREASPQVILAAGDKDQAGTAFKDCAHYARYNPNIARMVRILDSQKKMFCASNNGELEAIPSDEGGAHGLRPSAVIADELHVWKGRGFWDALRTGSGARAQPLSIAITTAGHDRTSICYEQYQYAKRVLAGEIDDPLFVAAIYEAAEDDDPFDEAVWRKANPALGTFRSLEEFRAAAREAKLNPGSENGFRQLYLNQWVQQVTRWLQMHQWNACHEGEPRTLDELADAFKGRQACGGLDLASVSDFNALVWAFPSDDGGIDVLPRFWLPADAAERLERAHNYPICSWAKQGFITLTDGNATDYAAIKAQIIADCKQFEVPAQGLGFDNWNAAQLTIETEKELQEEHGREMMVSIRQGYSLNDGAKTIEHALANGKLRHHGNPVLKWMASNACIKTDDKGNYWPTKVKGHAKVDGIIALAMACKLLPTVQSAIPDIAGAITWLD